MGRVPSPNLKPRPSVILRRRSRPTTPRSGSPPPSRSTRGHLFQLGLEFHHHADDRRADLLHELDRGSQGGGPARAQGLARAYQDGCTTNGFRYTNGANWYVTNGDTNDWSYGMWGDLDTTLEVTTTKTPPVAQISTFVAEHRQATINYMLKTFQGIHGVMTDQETGDPLDGTVTATFTASSTFPVPHD